MKTHESISESILASPAKINLHLRILGRRDDGYHELKTLFYPVMGLRDTIRIEPGHDENMYMRCPEHPELETTSNLIYTAWKEYGNKTGFQPGMFVTLNKIIPIGGGLGGGSSNAATMLRWLNDNAGSKRLTHTALMQLGAKLGADIPFFLSHGPAWETGIGEKLIATDVSLSEFTLLIVNPGVHINTKWAYEQWSEKKLQLKSNKVLTSANRSNKNPSPVSVLEVINDFETIVFESHPVIREAKETLIKLGAASAAMSGSGATLFGLFRNEKTANDAAEALEKNGLEIFTMKCE